MQEYIERPVLQMVFFILLSMVIIPILRPKNADSVWNIAGAIYGVFIVANAGLIVFVQQVWSYFWYSMLFSFVYLIVIALTIPGYIKLAKTEGTNENAMVFLIVMFHPLASLLLILLQWFYLKIVH